MWLGALTVDMRAPRGSESSITPFAVAARSLLLPSHLGRWAGWKRVYRNLGHISLSIRDPSLHPYASRINCLRRYCRFSRPIFLHPIIQWPPGSVMHANDPLHKLSSHNRDVKDGTDVRTYSTFENSTNNKGLITAMLSGYLRRVYVLPTTVCRTNTFSCLTTIFPSSFFFLFFLVFHHHRSSSKMLPLPYVCRYI